MSLHSYQLFVLAALALVLAPGPDMLYMLGRCVGQGRRAGILSALWFSLGGLVHITVAVLGLSTILAASATAFTVIKWVGAAYLVYLGLSTLWRRPASPAFDAHAAGVRGRTILWQAFLSDVLNPKVALFFLALLPQFVERDAPHPALQILFLGLTVSVIALPTNLLIVCCADRITGSLRRNASVSLWLRKGLGVLFIALGLRIAAEKI